MAVPELTQQMFNANNVRQSQSQDKTMKEGTYRLVFHRGYSFIVIQNPQSPNQQRYRPRDSKNSLRYKQLKDGRILLGYNVHKARFTVNKMFLNTPNAIQHTTRPAIPQASTRCIAVSTRGSLADIGWCWVTVENL
ncbi:uncharacterized protein LACBIDRAFT_334556 [Laccaria bicolor S238N-H82]|uniref:Predicted protein n=1 Tax=Laccaria bicolor (strain S238N-H82 / ATCC MYA-4686) TaxID=486041 RepID=B0DZM8_LACBS|nr:uncharacterized protein LACBIDRAFT_334556 [Laccaria bicolor S238N-H82]EDQ99943.1 predicted protein [Laccaria bicolor S238N-H82]|eukprot:XP_001889354.1 predicted protein [Laccaria bicolor S238N-H82]